MKKYFIVYSLLIVLLLASSSSDDLLDEDDLTFSYQEKGGGFDEYAEKTRKSTRSNQRSKAKSRSPSTYTTTTSTMQPPLTTTPRKTTDKTTPPPYTYTAEKINQTHGDMFANWIDEKSEELYEMTMNFSGYKLLNETYSVKLRNDAGFAWINFTEMIVNISKTISEVRFFSKKYEF